MVINCKSMKLRNLETEVTVFGDKIWILALENWNDACCHAAWHMPFDTAVSHIFLGDFSVIWCNKPPNFSLLLYGIKGFRPLIIFTTFKAIEILPAISLSTVHHLLHQATIAASSETTFVVDQMAQSTLLNIKANQNSS